MITLVWAGGGILFLSAISAVVYKLLRPKFSITVNCWFCDINCVVPFGNRNSWDCPKCEQYNGFTADGQYNKVIPAQSREELNHFVTAKSPSVSGSSCREATATAKNILCEKCNLNQQLKIKQLANFLPYDETQYDVEVEAYARRLEELYRLCRICELTVSQELQHQDQRIRSEYQIPASSCITSSRLINDSSHLQDYDVSISSFFRLLHVSCLLSSIFFVLFTLRLAAHHWLGAIIGPSYLDHAPDVIVIVGLFLQMAAAYTAKLCRCLRWFDVAACMVWLISIILLSILSDKHIYSSLWLIVRSVVAAMNLPLSTGCILFGRFSHKQVSKRRLSDSSRDESVQDGSGKSSVDEGTEDSGLPPDDLPLLNEVPCVDQIRTMRLGTPMRTTARKRGVFSMPRFSGGGGDALDSLSHALPSHESFNRPIRNGLDNVESPAASSTVTTQKPRPLLSPARFIPKPTVLQQRQILQMRQQHSILDNARRCATYPSSAPDAFAGGDWSSCRI